MKKISIIIPMYNVSMHLKACLQSVFNQELAEDDFEIVLVDDGSTDDSLKVAKQLTEGRHNITIVSQQNKGLGGARNTGIVSAEGRYLLFLDADDRLLPNVLSLLLNTVINCDLDILEFGAQGINSNGKILYEIKKSSKIFLSGFEYYYAVRYMHSACNKLYKRDFLINNSIYFLEKIYIEDFEFNTRCLANARKLKATDLVVSQFLQSANSITRNNDLTKKQKMTADIVTVIRKIDMSYKNRLSTKMHSLFYLERLNFLVATLFYQLVKRKASYDEIVALKEKLIADNLFYVNHKIFDIRKNLFRVVVLRNLWLFKIYNFISFR